MKFKRVLSIFALLLCLSVLFGCSSDNKAPDTPKEIAEAFINAYLEDDYILMDEYSAISQKDMMADEMDYYTKEEGYTEEKYWQEVAANYELSGIPKDYNDFAEMLKAAQKAYFEETFGKDYKISVAAEVTKTLTEEELPVFLTELKANEFEYKYFEIDEISAASAVAVTAELVSGELDEPRTEQFELLIVKINEKFKVLYVN